jgi:hypothetical protein
MKLRELFKAFDNETIRTVYISHPPEGILPPKKRERETLAKWVIYIQRTDEFEYGDCFVDDDDGAGEVKIFDTIDEAFRAIELRMPDDISCDVVIRAPDGHFRYPPTDPDDIPY